MKKFSLLFLIIFFVCSNNGKQNKFPPKPAPIIIPPLGKVDDWLVDSVTIRLEELMQRQVSIGKAMAIPQYAYNPSRKRFVADSLLVFLLHQKPTDFAKIIGITKYDIETHVGKNDHWGIMGLGFCPGNSCIVSCIRPQKKATGRKQLINRMVALCLHELGHTYSLDLCKDESCIMQDAKGRNRLDFSGRFCFSCKRKAELKQLL